MMSTARGLRLGITCSSRKRWRSSNGKYCDESSWLLKKGKLKQRLKKRSKKNNDDDDLLTRRKKRNINYYDDDESPRLLQNGKQQQQQLGRRSFSLSKCSTEGSGSSKKKQMDIVVTGFENQVGSSNKKQVIVCEHEEEGLLQNGDTLNVSDILFTKSRDWLVTYNDRDRPVQAKHLEGKVIVLHFVPIAPWCDYLKRHVKSLVYTYNGMHPNAAFEVVFIGLKVGKYASNQEKLLKYFEQKFSTMPWPAIPFFDIQPPEYYTPKIRFPSDWINDFLTVSVVVDPTGVVLQCVADTIFLSYGAEGYPFSDQRLIYLASQDSEALNHPSITTLLSSPERDYVINNKNQVVPLHTLEDKVVGLFFYYEDKPREGFIERLKRTYKQLAETENFEIVLVYIPYTYTSCKNARKRFFWGMFELMPWLALPYKDPKTTTLSRIFKLLPWDTSEPDPRLVIVGPQGKFIEPYGADILFKFGISAYPFTRQRVAHLEAKYLQELELDMLWDPNTCFARKNGPDVKLSQLVGKRIMVVLEGVYIPIDNKFWRKLKARYLQSKDTDAEFDVIYICKFQGSSYAEHVVATMSWLRPSSPISDLLLGFFDMEGVLVAFDLSGRVVRKTTSPLIIRGNIDFPFDADNLEKDALRRLVKLHEWDLFYLD